jgi:hypothetical protein
VAEGGSISAEHGIGLAKRHEIQRYKTPVELALMRAIKTALDPKGIMNPGKLRSGFTVADWLAGPRAREITAPPLTQGAAAGGGQP